MKQLKIEIEGASVMYADLLENLAPLTCKALEDDLPYECKTLSHDKFSGFALKLFADFKQKKAECSRSYGVAPGEILYIPHVVDAAKQENELMIVYGPAAIRNISGFGIGNLCARVKHEYISELYQVGNDINLHGERTIKLSIVEV